MEKIYHKHDSSNGMNAYWWDEDYYLCDTEEEYQQQLEKYKAKAEWAKKDYARRGYANYTPTLTKEKEIHAQEYYYGHQWTGKNFDAYGFTWTLKDTRCTETTHILKPGSVKNMSYADNSGCAGIYYGS